PWITTYPARVGRRALLQIPVETLVMAAIGLVVGLLAGALVAWPLSMLPGPLGWLLPIIVAIALAYAMTTVAALRAQDILSMFNATFDRRPGRRAAPARADAGSEDILLDTSVIIDGRIL